MYKSGNREVVSSGIACRSMCVGIFNFQNNICIIAIRTHQTTPPTDKHSLLNQVNDVMT